ncbi:MAG: Gfo/Idh/MocA family oxidoreductase, partial [Clostridia bacterium]|nr:Gfo/Idh/MocA family oxidoreductase [Clostridia bacterium]
IDVVTVAIPDQQHVKVSCDLLRAGKHVLCEKPLALTREDIEEMVRVADECAAKFMVGQICRFTPAFEKAKEIIESGTIGELYFVESEYAHDYMKLCDDWRADPKRHGVIGGGCHAVDLLRWLAGDPVEVFAYGTHRLLPMVDYDDATIAIMKFNDNLAGKVFVSTGCKRDYTMRTVIYGTKGTIICDNTSPELTLYTVDEEGVTKEPEKIPVEVNNHNAVKEFEVFADAILNDKPVVTDAREGAKTVAVCLAIVEAATTGKIVKPDYKF